MAKMSSTTVSESIPKSSMVEVWVTWSRSSMAFSATRLMTWSMMLWLIVRSRFPADSRPTHHGGAP